MTFHKRPDKMVSSEDLFGRLYDRAEQRYPELMTKQPGSLGEWATLTPIVLDGRPFTFDRHEYLIEPYRDDHPCQVDQSGSDGA